ncbi:MAG TPA: copper resistance protein CopC [Dehalococcoidia bacterium]|nr:copper resistance protein CopC [Dehalococcoidia bacterium]
MRLIRFAVPIAVAMAMVLPSVAFAHARLKSSTPTAGAILQASPAQVEIIFSEDIRKVAGDYSIQVARDRGASVTTGPAVIDDTNRSRMTVQLQPNLGPGRYVVNWHNVSDADGDPLDGAFSFYIRTQPNTVDLANDAQLAQIGAPETPGAATSTAPASAAGTSAPATSAAGTAAPAARPAATAVAAPASSSGSSNTTVYVIIGVLAAAAIAAAGAWWIFARRSA